MNKKVYQILALLAGFLMLFGFLGCNSSDDGGDTAASSSLNGTAANGPIVNGTVQVFYFASNGTLQELAATNAPVTTNGTGAYEFKVSPNSLQGVNGSLIVRVQVTNGTTMFGQPAPQLEAVLADPANLKQDGGKITQYLNAASTVAAGLLRNQFEGKGQPSVANGTAANQQVQQQLGFDPNQNPNQETTGVAQLNNSIDQNLQVNGTSNTEGTRINQFLNFLTKNIQTGQLDNQVIDPGTNATANASQANVYQKFGNELQQELPSPSRFVFFAANSQSTTIGNDGVSAATVTFSLKDGIGSGLGNENITLTAAPQGSLSATSVTTNANGTAQVTVTTQAQPGTRLIVEGSYTTQTGKTLTRKVGFDVQDCRAVSALTVNAPGTVNMGNPAAITATLAATCAGSTVQDGTEVQFAITSGKGTLSSQTAKTSNGQASVNLTSNTANQSVTVEVSQGEFSQTVTIQVITDPCDPDKPNVTAADTTICTNDSTTISIAVPAVGNCTSGVNVTTADVEVSGTAMNSGTSLSSQTVILTNGKGTVTLTTAGQATGTLTVTAKVTDSQGTVKAGSTKPINVHLPSQTSTVTVSLQNAPAGIMINGGDLTIDYNESAVSFSKAAVGTLITQGFVDQNNNATSGVVKLGLILGSPFKGTQSGSIMDLTFNNTGTCMAQPSDFAVTNAIVYDSNGKTVQGLDKNNIDLSITNN